MDAIRLPLGLECVCVGEGGERGEDSVCWEEGECVLVWGGGRGCVCWRGGVSWKGEGRVGGGVCVGMGRGEGMCVLEGGCELEGGKGEGEGECVRNTQEHWRPDQPPAQSLFQSWDALTCGVQGTLSRPHS